MVIDQFTDAYFNAQTKFEKSRVVQQVFKELSVAARFLRKDSVSRNFFLISDADARQKISHAIRYRRQNGSGSSRSSSPNGAIPSPSSPTDDTDFFSRDERTSPYLQSSTHRSGGSFVFRLTPRAQVTLVVIDLFSDEELDGVLGAPYEYDTGDETCGFDWPELSSISSLEFADEATDEKECEEWDFRSQWHDEVNCSGKTSGGQEPDGEYDAVHFL